MEDAPQEVPGWALNVVGRAGPLNEAPTGRGGPKTYLAAGWQLSWEVPGSLAWAFRQFGSVWLAPVSKPRRTCSVSEPGLAYTGRGVGCLRPAHRTHYPPPGWSALVHLWLCVGTPLGAHHSCWCTTSHCTAECSDGELGDVHVNLCGCHGSSRKTVARHKFLALVKSCVCLVAPQVVPMHGRMSKQTICTSSA